jgi:hypothetical protein
LWDPGSRPLTAAALQFVRQNLDRLMKKIALIALLIPLVLFEAYLCTAFLPLDWQHTIDVKIRRVLPESHDWTPITHPNLDQEIEQVLHENVWLKIALYFVTISLLAGNAFTIRGVWRLLRGGRTAAGIA